MTMARGAGFGGKMVREASAESLFFPFALAVAVAVATHVAMLAAAFSLAQNTPVARDRSVFYHGYECVIASPDADEWNVTPRGRLISAPESRPDLRGEDRRGDADVGRLVLHGFPRRADAGVPTGAGAQRAAGRIVASSAASGETA